MLGIGRDVRDYQCPLSHHKGTMKQNSESWHLFSTEDWRWTLPISSPRSLLTHTGEAGFHNVGLLHAEHSYIKLAQLWSCPNQHTVSPCKLRWSAALVWAHWAALNVYDVFSSSGERRDHTGTLTCFSIRSCSFSFWATLRLAFSSWSSRRVSHSWTCGRQGGGTQVCDTHPTAAALRK